MHRWTRLSTRKWEDAWDERLAFLGPGQVAMMTWPDSNALKIHAFGDKKTVDALVKRFGGQASQLPAHMWTGDPARPRAPLSIRGRLRIHSDEASWKACTDPSDLLIPAGMAFGTGEHATTATCLRLLCDLEPDLPERWTALDAGTGSGILAIAAEKLGASRVEAFDFDPACVRIARENARVNRCRRVRVVKADARDVRAFAPADVVLANLFSELLMASARGFASKLPAGGHLIFSGVLRRQADEVAAALVAAGFEPPKIIPRGKWCAGHTLRKTAKLDKRSRRSSGSSHA